MRKSAFSDDSYRQDWIQRVREKDSEEDKGFFETRPSKIEGVGWFAVRDIPAGQCISHYIVAGSDPCRLKDIEDPDRTAIQWEVGSSGVYISFPKDHTRRYLNHSCEPNALLRIVYFGRSGGPDLQVIALRSIKKDEEITIDYSTTQFEDWEMEGCKCGTPSCRHVITDFNQLPDELQKNFRNKNLIPLWMERELRWLSEGRRR